MIYPSFLLRVFLSRIITLIILKTDDEYYCRIYPGKIPKDISEKEIVYQDEETWETLADMRIRSAEMKKKAIEWAREKKIPFVYNLDSELYG